MGDQIRTCFITAPPDADIRRIRESLIQRGVEVLGLPEIEVGSRIPVATLTSIADADLVVGVLTHGRSTSALFELGVAVGYGRPIIIFAPAKSDIVPFALERFQIVRTSLQNREAIDFAFDQLLASPNTPLRSDTAFVPRREQRPLATSGYRAQLEALLKSGHARELEKLVAQVLRDTGAEVVVEAPASDHAIDLVVWSDGLQPYVGNPFPIEIKSRLTSRDTAKHALNQAANAARAIGSNWSMLLYAEGPAQDDRIWLSSPNVLALKIDELFAQLETGSFAHVVRTLRNRRVHGFDY